MARRYLAYLSVAACLGLPAHAATENRDVSQTMRSIFAAMAELLPASFDEDGFSAPSRQATLQPSVQLLAESTRALEEHARIRGPGFAALSHALADDAREVVRFLERERYSEAQFYLLQLTQNCAGCHSRLPRAREFAFSEQLLERVDLDAMEIGDRARLLVAARQFERAATLWEHVFADRSLDPADLDLSEVPVRYLTLCLRVLGDIERPRATLEAFGGRSDVPRYLRHMVESWSRSLTELAARRDLKPGLKLARELVAKARERARVPSDRSGLVYDLMASGLLHRYVDGRTEPAPDLGEAYYLLGVTAARTSQFQWVPEAEFHLEASIRLDPQGDYAEPAYRLLEEYTVLSYGGMTSDFLPQDVRAKLAELQALLDGTPPAEAR